MTVVVGSVALVALGFAVWLLVRWAMNWGATALERQREMSGDDWLDGSRWSVRMTRGIGIDVPAAVVWPWLAQLGRGAGWYSWDLLDNGGHRSARHLVSWIPPVCIGDASAIGYVRHLRERREIAWWLDEIPYLGARVRAVMTYSIEPRAGGDQSRLVLRIQADAKGLGAALVMTLFPVIDSIMACRQLLNLKRRAEWYGSRAEDPFVRETGRRDQYQVYEVIYASGERAGAARREGARRQRRYAVRDGIVTGGAATEEERSVRSESSGREVATRTGVDEAGPAH